MNLQDDRRWLSIQGVVNRPDKDKVVKCYVDDKFYSGWFQADADSAENFMSCSGYAIMYAICPVLW